MIRAWRGGVVRFSYGSMAVVESEDCARNTKYVKRVDNIYTTIGGETKSRFMEDMNEVAM